MDSIQQGDRRQNVIKITLHTTSRVDNGRYITLKKEYPTKVLKNFS